MEQPPLLHYGLMEQPPALNESFTTIGMLSLEQDRRSSFFRLFKLSNPSESSGQQRRAGYMSRGYTFGEDLEARAAAEEEHLEVAELTEASSE